MLIAPATALAATGDGTGTLTVSPTHVVAGSSGNRLSFTYTPGPAGIAFLRLTIPTGWTAPQDANAANAGFVDFSGNTCAVATVISISGQVVTVFSVCSSSETFVLRYGVTGPGVTAPPTPGGATFTAATQTLAGSFANIASSPVVTVISAPTVTSTSPNSRGQGATSQDITITGTGFVTGATAAFSGTGITVNSTTFGSATSLTANITITAGATTGPRNVTVTNPDTGAGTGTGVFTVIAATATSAAAASATYGDTSVLLSATVNAPHGDVVNAGTVTFTIKNGAATIGTVTSGTVTNNAASASFPLTASINALTYTINAAYSGATGFAASDNSLQPPPNLTIGTRPITVAAATDTKGYDGTKTSVGLPQITLGTLAFGQSASWSQTFDTASVGTGKTLTPAGAVSDGNSGLNYAVTFVTDLTGVITAKGLTVSGITADNKVYDGGTAAVLNTGTAALVGVVIGDTNVTLNVSGAVGAFGNPNAATGKTVTVSGLTLEGTSAGNYTFTEPTALANITKAPASVTPNPASKVAGSADPVLTGTLSGFLPADGVTATYSRTAGETVAGSPYTISATLASTGILANYNITSNTASFTITAAPLDHLVLAPATKAVNPGVSQAYTATGFDAFNNSLGDVTSATTFTISGGGSCTAASCSSMLVGSHTVTGTDGSAKGTATLTVTGVLGVVSNSTFHALTPTRILDTRNGTGGISGAIGEHSAQPFQVAGNGGVPANASAVTGNLTVTGQTSNGYLFLGPIGANNPTSSTLNFPVGDDRANAVTVGLGASGALWVTFVAPTVGQTTQVVFDVTGYFTPDNTGATYHALTPTRILDSRNGTGGITGLIAEHSGRSFQVTGNGNVPADAMAVTGTLTVTGQTSNGYLFLGPNATNNPTSSTLNFPVGDDRANAVTVALSGSGALWVTFVAPTVSQTTHVVFDVTGYFTPDMTGAAYVPLTPARILDSRNGTGGISGRIGEHSAQAFEVTGNGNVPADAMAVTGNLTVTGQTSNGYLFLGPIAANNPTSSTLNFPVADDRANAVTVGLSGSGALWVTFVAPTVGQTTHVVFDVGGYFVPASF